LAARRSGEARPVIHRLHSPRCGRGPSGFDVKHRAVTSYVYELPFGKGKRWLADNAVAGKIVGGWQLSGISTLTTGRPFNVTLATGVNNGAPSWPNRIGSGKLDNPDPFRWFNPADFVAPHPAQLLFEAPPSSEPRPFGFPVMPP
jgi:hypothetical protein